MIVRMAVCLALAFAVTVAWAWGVLPVGVALVLGWGAGTLFLFALFLASSRPELQVFGPAIVRAREHGAVALTLDDGPDPESTPALLDALREAEAHATFFVLADRVERHPELLARMMAEGHEIAYHGRAHHPWLTTWSPRRGQRELKTGLEILARHGVRTRWFRPPFGVVSPRLFAAIQPLGLQLVWCSVRTGDGGPISEVTLRERCAKVVGTDIVLLHEGAGRLAAKMLPEILREWDARGIRVTTLSDAMGLPS